MATQPKAPTGEVGVTAEIAGAPYGVLGDNRTWQGFVHQAEHVPELLWPESIRWYERMLYTDTRIEAGFLSLTQPLWDYVWALEPGEADLQATQYLAADLGLPVGMPAPSDADDNFEIPPGRFGFNFLAHMTEALQAAPLGHYFFELVGDYHGPDSFWRLENLAPRAPGTLMEILTDASGQLVGVRQKFSRMSPAQMASGQRNLGLTWPPIITGDRLVPYVWRKDGRVLWYGRPMLRSLYRHWLVKDTLIRIDAINHDRAGGVPIAETDATYNGDLNQLGEMMKAFRVSEDGGGAMPPGAKMVLERVGGTDVIGSIRYHDEQLGSSWEDQVGQLGMQGGGNRALGQTFAGLQALARRAVARWFVATFRENLIRIWWNYNVPALPDGSPAPYPQLVFRPRKEVVGAVESEVPPGAPGVAPGPAPTGNGNGGPPGGGGANPPPAATASPSPPPSTAAAAPRESERPASRASRALSAVGEPGALGGGARLPARTLRREPYDFEAKAAVDFATMDATHTTVLTDVHRAYTDMWLPAQMRALDKAIRYTKAEAPRTRLSAADMAKIEAPVVGQDELADMLYVAASRGADGALAELSAQGVSASAATEAVLRAAVRDHAAAIAQMLANGLSVAASRKAVQVSAGRTPQQVASEVGQYLGGLKHQWERDQLTGAVQQAQNAGRFAVFQPKAQALRFYASELLDDATCDVCEAADGTEDPTLDAAVRDYPSGGNVGCLGGPRCRGTIVGVDAEA
jgi:hypothetical protein